MKTEEYNITSLNEYLSFLDMYRIAGAIKEEKGYDIAGHLGIRVPEKKQAPPHMFGILKERPPLEKSILGIKRTKPQKSELLGELWEEDGGYLLKVYGQDNYIELIRLIKKHLLSRKSKLDKIIYQDKREEGCLFDYVA